MSDINRVIVALRSNTNWQEFVEHLQERKLSVVEQMIDCKEPMELHRLQGKAKQLNELLDLADARRAEATIKEQSTKIKPNLGGF